MVSGGEPPEQRRLLTPQTLEGNVEGVKMLLQVYL
jgi:hypothetical protein